MHVEPDWAEIRDIATGNRVYFNAADHPDRGHIHAAMTDGPGTHIVDQTSFTRAYKVLRERGFGEDEARWIAYGPRPNLHVSITGPPRPTVNFANHEQRPKRLPWDAFGGGLIVGTTLFASGIGIMQNVPDGPAKFVAYGLSILVAWFGTRPTVTRLIESRRAEA